MRGTHGAVHLACQHGTSSSSRGPMDDYLLSYIFHSLDPSFAFPIALQVLLHLRSSATASLPTGGDTTNTPSRRMQEGTSITDKTFWRMWRSLSCVSAWSARELARDAGPWRYIHSIRVYLHRLRAAFGARGQPATFGLSVRWDADIVGRSDLQTRPCCG